MVRGIRLTDLEMRILDTLSNSGGLSVQEIEAALGCEGPDDGVRGAMVHLRHHNLIQRKTRGSDNRIRWTTK